MQNRTPGGKPGVLFFVLLKIILQSRPSVFKFNLKRTVIFCKKKFSHLQPPQAGRAGTTSQVLNLIFYKSSFKTLVGLRPNPMFSKKIALTVYPR